MGVKFVLALACAWVLLDNGCQAGKGFGGGGGIALIYQLRFQVVAAQQQVKLAVDTANTTIQNNIATAENSIDAELKASQNRVAASGANAHCANQHKTSVAAVNCEAVKTCDQAAQFQAIELQVTLLNSIHSQMSAVYTACPFWLPGSQAVCLQNFSEGVSTQVTDERDAILAAATAATSDAAKCILDESEKAHGVVSAADNAFDECVNSSSA